MANRNNFSDQDRVYSSDLGDNSDNIPADRAGYTGDYDRQVEADARSIDPNLVTAHARPATQDEVAYRNGYVEGQDQQRAYEDIQRTRAENSAVTGTIIGILIASIAGLVLATLYFMPQSRQPQVAPAPTANPTQPQNNSTQPQNPNRTTIIERVREVPATPQNTEIIVTPSVTQPAQPAPTQPVVPTQPNLTQPADPLPSEQVNPDSSVTNPVDPAIPVDPSLSQPNVTPEGTGTTGQ